MDVQLHLDLQTLQVGSTAWSILLSKSQMKCIVLPRCLEVLVSGVRHNHIHMNARTQGFPEEHLIVHINSPAIFYCCISSDVAALKLESLLYSLFP